MQKKAVTCALTASSQGSHTQWDTFLLCHCDENTHNLSREIWLFKTVSETLHQQCASDNGSWSVSWMLFTWKTRKQWDQKQGQDIHQTPTTVACCHQAGSSSWMIQSILNSGINWRPRDQNKSLWGTFQIQSATERLGTPGSKCLLAFVQ